MDHTPANLFCVDRLTGVPLGRPTRDAAGTGAPHRELVDGDCQNCHVNSVADVLMTLACQHSTGTPTGTNTSHCRRFSTYSLHCLYRSDR
ncbi:hypothetical protein ACNJEB_21385, partial [Mycobacterium tuberculosis]